MKFLRIIHLLVIFTFLAACGSNGLSPLPTATSLPPPAVTIESIGDPALSLRAYFEAFKVEDYNTMYSLVSRVTQDTVTLEDFALRNRNALNEMSARSFDYEVLSSLVNPYSAELAYRVTYHTALVGELQREIIAKLVLEGGEWKLNWDDSLILPELAGGNTLKMNYSIPARGNIYDRNGAILAGQADAYAFYVIPGNVTDQSLGALLSEAWLLCGISQERLANQIANTPAQFPIPLCEASEDESLRIRSVYPSGLAWDTYNSRFYFRQGAGSNIIGYTQQVPAERLDEYRRRGYRGDERVGTQGIEQWAEDYLSGTHGGELYVINPTGGIVTKVGESAPQAADSVYLTIDRNLQFYAEEAIEGFRGAVVVMERDTGRVLAMATSPDFDSNIFSPGNPNGSAQIGELFQRTDNPLVNRAAQGQYPLGSVFKVITMAAAMESGLFIPESTYDCQYEWTRLPDRIRYDWTRQHCDDRLARGLECNTSDSIPSGLLTLSEGLMRSCNPFFWEMGYTLYQNNRANDIANMARAFGLGQSTGIEQVSELAGLITDPATAIDVVNQSIGQGDMLVTPLQVARFMAALGNGGTLFRPQLVEKIAPVDGSAETVLFKPTAQGALPVQPFRLDFMQESMLSVVRNPNGTAYFRMRGLAIPIAGKTGTAESGSGLPHAWFAGYTLASESTNLPDIAIAVVIENIGEGSDYAAPVFKRIVEVYYYGAPRTLYWFESNFGVTRTPTPFGGIPTETPEE